MKNPSTLKKILLSLLIVGTMTSVIGVGTFATFTATTDNPGNTFATGTLTMNTSSPSASFITLSNMIPGDSTSSLLTVLSTGTEDMTYTLTTSVTSGSTLLDSDTTNGLKVYAQRCSVAWTGTGGAATCSGTAGDVLGTSAAPVPIIQSAVSLGNLCNSGADSQRATRGNSCVNGTITVKDSDYLKIRVNLATTAGNTFQGLSDTIKFTWTGTQVTGASF